jgi:O-antigen ligase
MFGSAIYYGDRVGYYLILLLPLIFYIYSFKKLESISFPKRLTLIWVGFSLFDLISTIMSSNKQLSIERFLLYQAFFLVLTYVSNKKQLFKYIIDKTVIYCSYIFIGLFIYSKLFPLNDQLFDKGQLLNFFHPIANGNNHLGVWLGMSLLILYDYKKYIQIILIVPFYLFSLSRTAFVGLFSTAIASSRAWKKNMGLVVLSAAVFIVSIYIFVPRSEFLSDRIQFYSQSVMGFIDKPLFGYGSGNFLTLSRNFSKVTNGVYANNGHNIFLDVLSENGIFGFVFFVMFVWLIFKNNQGKEGSRVLFYLFICSVVSYIYKSPAFMLVFSIYIGIGYKEEKRINSNRIYSLTAVTVSLLAILLAYSEALYFKGKYIESIRIYPYRRKAYEMLISQYPVERKTEALHYLGLYKKNFPGQFEQLIFSANIHWQFEEYQKSLDDYIAIYNAGSGFSPVIADQIKRLYLRLGQPIKAYYFSKGFIREVLSNKSSYKHLVNDTYMFCINTNDLFLDKGACF